MLQRFSDTHPVRGDHAQQEDHGVGGLPLRRDHAGAGRLEAGVGATSTAWTLERTSARRLPSCRGRPPAERATRIARARRRALEPGGAPRPALLGTRMNLWDSVPREGLTRDPGARSTERGGRGARPSRQRVDPGARSRPSRTRCWPPTSAPPRTDRADRRRAPSALRHGRRRSTCAARSSAAAAELLRPRAAPASPGRAERAVGGADRGRQRRGQDDARRQARGALRARRAAARCWWRPTRSAPPPPSSSRCGRRAPASRSCAARDGADPAAVVHDGLAAARARGADVVLVDTAGPAPHQAQPDGRAREGARVCARVGARRAAPRAAGAGRHARAERRCAQAREFASAPPVTSLAVNKLDGTARGGAVLAIAGRSSGCR